MTSYVSRGRGAKKAEALKRTENGLRGAVKRNDDLRILEKMAARVREAKLGYLKSVLFEVTSNPYEQVPASELDNLRSEQKIWRERSLAEVIRLYE